MHAISAAALAGLSGVGASLRFESFRTAARAASLRPALRLGVLEAIGRTLEADTEADDVLLARRLAAAWERSCVLSFMLRARREALRLPAEVREAPDLQRRIVRF